MDTYEFTVERTKWTNNLQFLIASIGSAAGLSNVWRFPYLAYKNGGAAFILIYLILQQFIGIPIYIMESATGQYSSRGPLFSWKMCPCFQGLGVSMTLICFYVGTYYNVIVTYSVFYIFSSMKSSLEWTSCSSKDWILCEEDINQRQRLPECLSNSTSLVCRCSSHYRVSNCTPTPSKEALNPAESFYSYELTTAVESVDISAFGLPYKKPMACLAFAWVIVAIVLMFGIQITGKIAFSIVILPYLILAVLMIVGLLQNGSIKGIEYFILPDWSKLAEYTTWTTACGQLFYSLGLCRGTIVVYSSYCNFHTNIIRNSVIITTMDFLTSFIAGFTIFSVIGFLADEEGVAVTEIARSKSYLAFVLLPAAYVKLSLPQLMSLLFFLMFFFLGITTEIAIVECLVTVMQDKWPQLRTYQKAVVIAVCFSMFALGVPMLSPGGKHVIELMDFFGGEFSLFIIGATEIVVISWIYGAKRILKDIELMIGSKVSFWYWGSAFYVFAPVGTLILLGIKLVQFEAPTFDSTKPYPTTFLAIGYFILATIIAPTVLWFLYSLFKAKGTLRERLKQMTDPKDWLPDPTVLQGKSFYASSLDASMSLRAQVSFEMMPTDTSGTVQKTKKIRSKSSLEEKTAGTSITE